VIKSHVYDSGLSLLLTTTIDDEKAHITLHMNGLCELYVIRMKKIGDDESHI